MKNLFRRDSRPVDANVAIDLGTANTLVVKRGSGVVFNEPSVCCFTGSGTKKSLFAAGSEASAMVGRVTRDLQITRPLRGGVLSDMDAGRELIRYAIGHARSGWSTVRLKALIGVPADATQAERRALKTAAHDAGIAKVELLDEPLLAAIGTGLDVQAPRGRMLVDCGAGITEVVIIALGGICLSRTTRIGGDTLDAALVDYLHLRHRFQIGPSAAESLKLRIIQLLETGEAESLVEIAGQNMATGLPQTLSLPCRELLVVYERHLQAIVDTVRSALLETAPELSQDIFEDGLMLTGGASMVKLLRDRITEATGLATHCPPDPLNSVARGLETLLHGPH
jgi:rod shape-determining protein MreB and related proteins